MACSRSRDGGFFGSRYWRINFVLFITGTMGCTHLKYESISSSQRARGGRRKAPRWCRMSISTLSSSVSRALEPRMFSGSG